MWSNRRTFPDLILVHTYIKFIKNDWGDAEKTEAQFNYPFDQNVAIRLHFISSPHVRWWNVRNDRQLRPNLISLLITSEQKAPRKQTREAADMSQENIPQFVGVSNYFKTWAATNNVFIND